MYEAAYKNINDAVKRIERVADLAEKQAKRMDEMIMYQRLLQLNIDKQEGATLPCNTLPVAENQRFHGREDILLRIDNHLTPSDTSTRLSSIALHGLGGIGKTQIALAYAYKQLDALDAVFWISAEDSLSVQQSFSRVALDALKLPKAHPQAYQENMVLVLDWLQKTSKRLGITVTCMSNGGTDSKWLLIFDNVDSHEVLSDCWPVSRHGAVLVTTRDVVVATLPIDTGLEVNEFDDEQGAEFLLAMASGRLREGDEAATAKKVAQQLGGLPLAINQMAALINARNLSLRQFEVMYTKHEQRLHNQKKSGWKYLGYKHSLDSVWQLSFENLSNDARAFLGVLSFFSADSIPLEVFKTEDPERLPPPLAFCEDELR
jgi:hypothetical protein